MNRVTNKFITKAIRREYSFKLETRVTHRPSYTVFRNGRWQTMGLTSRRACLLVINGLVAHDTDIFLGAIRKLRKLGLTVSIRKS